MRDNIIKKYKERYSTDEEEVEHIFDLINLISHQKHIDLTIEDVKFILNKNTKECNIASVKKNMSKLKDSSPTNVAKMLFKITNNRLFDSTTGKEFTWTPGAQILFKDWIIQAMLDGFKEYLEKYNLEYNLNDLKSCLYSELISAEANKFKEKLSRETGKKITVKEIESMNWFEFEELLGRIYREAWYKIRVTKKTGDQWADLIIEKDWISTAIQAKRYSGSVGNSAVQEVVAAMKFYDCDKAMVITTADFTRSAIELAKRNKVELINKKWLDRLFDSIT